jgi:hypothetical protein
VTDGTAAHAPPGITEVEQYVAAEAAFPEPRAVYGPHGPRFVGSSDATPPPIEDARR